MNIIALVGKKQSGKDSVCRIIKQYYHMGKIKHWPIRLAFADEIKQEIANAFGIDKEVIDDNKNDSVVRRILQLYGVDKRTVDSQYWIKLAETTLNRFVTTPPHINPPYLYIFTDTRFLNEAEWILKQGGKLVKVVRPTQGELELDNHISETELDKIPCNHVINNDGSLKQLELPVLYVLEQLGYV